MVMWCGAGGERLDMQQRIAASILGKGPHCMPRWVAGLPCSRTGTVPSNRLFSRTFVPRQSRTARAGSTQLSFDSPNGLPLRLLRRMESFWSGRHRDNRSLIEMLQERGIIKSKRVADVMEQIDRGFFVPERNLAYVDSPMPIGFNATISAPHMHGLCLELLEDHLQPGMRALDVGSGSGYLTACFALMVGQQGHVVGVEHIPELVQQSIDNVNSCKIFDLLAAGNLSFHLADGRHGWPDEAPYDTIHVGAAASYIPEALVKQLKPGGRMVIPIGDIFQDLQVIDKQSDGSVKEWSATSVRYVPLIGKNEQIGY
eukprot:c20158_g1_i1 orf=517-1458(-)